MTSSTLDITPRTTRGAVSNAEPITPAPASRSAAVRTAYRRATDSDYPLWLDHVRSAAGCTRPIRLTGDLYTVARTGRAAAVLDHRHTDQLPDAAIYKACGNRRASLCPSCAQTYQYDAYQLVRAGLVGGKGVPDTVSNHPVVFVTLTAPSFGTVHTRVVRRHTCVDRRRCDCRPEPCHARRDIGLCVHGQAAVCWARHDPTDPRLGQPFCLDCYDYDHHVVWNHAAGELWRRTKQTAERHLAHLCRQRHIPYITVRSGDGTPQRIPPVRISHGKAAEFQRRGVVHFHALLRLDGIDSHNPDAIVSPPAGITIDDLDAAVRYAVAHTTCSTPAHPDRPTGWPIGWGDQLDVRPIILTGHGDITDSKAAGYLAKYATKSTEPTGHRSIRLTPDSINDHADPDGEHTARLIDACWRLGRPTHTPTPLRDRPARPRPATRLGPQWTCGTCRRSTRLAVCPHCIPTTPVDTRASTSVVVNPYAGLRRWAHMLGFGGHFLTKPATTRPPSNTCATPASPTAAPNRRTPA